MNFLTILLICSITVSIVAVVFWILSSILLRKCSVKWLYVTWITIIISYIISLRPVFDFRALSSIPPVAITQEKLTALANYSSRLEKINSQPNEIFSLYHWALYIWLIGFLVAAALQIIQHIHFVKLFTRNSQNADTAIIKSLEQVSERFGIKSTVQVKVCSLVQNPIMIGYVNPTIILPNNDFSNEELTVIFQHELTHFKNKDLWWRALALLATTIHWFNPVVYLAAHATMYYCELACDKLVVRGAISPIRKEYSNRIIALTNNHFKTQAHTSLSINLRPTKREAEMRILSILSTRRKRAGVSVLVMVVICIVLIGTAFNGFVIPPSMQYYERKWATNTQWNENLYKDEPKTNLTQAGAYPFMGTIKISYLFNKGKNPSWLDNSNEFQINVSAYNTVMLQGVNFMDISESAAFADYQLSLKYLEMQEKGFADKKPQQSEYSYKIEFPGNISDYKIAVFYKGPEASTPEEQNYYVTYKQNGTVFKTQFTPEQLKYYNESIEQAAERSVEDFAKKSGITLPDDFQDNIEIYQN